MTTPDDLLERLSAIEGEARREAFEEAATIAEEYAAQMWAVAESRRDQGMFEAAYQHEAAREACNVVAELIRARSLIRQEGEQAQAAVPSVPPKSA